MVLVPSIRPFLTALAVAILSLLPVRAQTIDVSLSNTAPVDDLVASFVGSDASSYAWSRTSASSVQIGQNFRVSTTEDHLLQAITLRLSTVPSDFTVASGFQFQIYETSTNLENPVTLGVKKVELGGTLQLSTTDAGKFITFDLGSHAFTAQAGKYYTFLLVWDGEASHNRVSFVTGANYPASPLNGYRWSSSNAGVDWSRVTGSVQGLSIYVTTASAIPEPSASMLGLGALLVIGLFHRRGRKGVSLTVMATLLLAGSSWAGEGVLVADGGKAYLVISTARDASPQVQEAAATLARYLEKSTGASFPLEVGVEGKPAIHVGALPEVKVPADLDADGFFFAGTGDGGLAIVGGSDWGTEFGVYEFLERYIGVRWLMPTELWEEVPQQSRLEIPRESFRSEPVYLSRRLSPLLNLESPKPEPQWARRNRARGRIEFHHQMKELFPVSLYGQSNPEFYPILNGKRFIPPDEKNFHWQPNFSAPGIVEAAVAEICDYFERHPEATSYSLGVNDLGFYDQSPESKARRKGGNNFLGDEDVSNDYYLWANEVAQGVLKRYPDKWFGLLAYSNVIAPPDFPLHPRLVPFLTYERMRWEDPELRAAGHQLTQEWQEAAATIGWYDYAYGIPYLVPRVWFGQMAQYLQWGGEHGVRHHYAELYPNWGEGPKGWVYARLLWNPEQDAAELVREWCEAAVGPKAARHLAAFYFGWEAFWKEEMLRPGWSRKGGQYLPFLDPGYLAHVSAERLEESDRLMSETLANADTPLRRERAATLAKMWRYQSLSVRVWQGEAAWRNADTNSEQGCLALIASGRETLRLNEERLALFDSFENDPLYHQVHHRLDGKFNELSGRHWGEAPFWSVIPFAQHHEKVRQQLEALGREEGGSPQLQTLARGLALAAAGEVEGRLRNVAFSDGLDHWQPERRESFRAEEKRLRFEGGEPARISQRTRYLPGRYYGVLRCSLPEGSREARAGIAFHTVDGTGRVRGGILPSGEVTLQAGKEMALVVPLTLTQSNVPHGVAVELRYSVMVQGDALEVTQAELYRIE